MAEALTNQAYEYLYRKIVSCEYLPGQELNEKQLLEETSFGRTPLREALLMLQAENLIDIFPRKGMRITGGGTYQVDVTEVDSAGAVGKHSFYRKKYRRSLSDT